jgi:hypothetical protein
MCCFTVNLQGYSYDTVVNFEILTLKWLIHGYITCRMVSISIVFFLCILYMLVDGFLIEL